jgi:hypothetical protein
VVAIRGRGKGREVVDVEESVADAAGSGTAECPVLVQFHPNVFGRVLVFSP